MSHTLTMTTVEARENFGEALNEAAFGNKTIILTRRGKPLVALISLSRLKVLEDVEKHLPNPSVLADL